jgi:Protein of unknown function (DUF3325)
MLESLQFAGSLVCCVLGCSWFALAKDVHWREAMGATALSRATQTRLRMLGATALLVSLTLSLTVDHPSIAALVWIMMLAAAAMLVAFALSWKAHWFAALVPWRRVEG